MHKMLTRFVPRRWFISVSNSNKLLEAPAGKISEVSPLPSPSISVHNETNNVTNIVTPPAVEVPIAA